MSPHPSDGPLAGVTILPGVVAEIVAALPPRLQKRLDAAVGKLAARPVTRDGDVVSISVDDDAALTLTAVGGVVRTVDDVVCGCLLAPSCVHRAAAVSLLEVADAPDEAPDAQPADETGGDRAGAEATAGSGARTGAEPGPPALPLTTAHRDAAQALWAAAAAVLDAGVPGAGAVAQAALLRGAHSARLAGLHRGAAAAVAVTSGLRAARAGDAAYRLPDLTAALHELLDTAHELTRAEEAVPAEAVGTARQPYAHAGALRLYGLFSEPVRTASGHAGVVTYVLGPDHVIRSVSDVMPGGAERIAGAAARAVRMGDTALDHHALSRAGLILSGATESPTGRLGAGASVRAVSASGVDWSADPTAALWAEPLAAQVSRVLRARDLPQDARRAGSELLFLDVEILGLTDDRILARCPATDTVARLLVADDHPSLPYRDNLRLLASRPGLALRLIGRLEAGPEPSVRVLAVAPGTTPATTPDDAPRLTLAPASTGRVNLGLDRLTQADIGHPEHGTRGGHSGVRPHPPETVDAAPLYLLHRQIERVVAGGRAAAALSGALPRDAARLRRDGLATGADLLEHLAASAADRGRDVFGRLLPADTGRLARCWLALSAYARAVDAALTEYAWRPPEQAGRALG